MVGVVYKNICAKYSTEIPRSKWDTAPTEVENDQAKILWDFQIQTDEQEVMSLYQVMVTSRRKKMGSWRNSKDERGAREEVEGERVTVVRCGNRSSDTQTGHQQMCVQLL